MEGFEDYLSISKHVNVYRPDQVTMERANDIIWRPVPYIAQSHDGTDATANFDEAAELAVPATIGYSKHSTAIMTATELRDALQENRLGQAAKQKLASDINVALVNFCLAASREPWWSSRPPPLRALMMSASSTP